MDQYLRNSTEAAQFLSKALTEQLKQGLISKKTYDELLKRINENTDATEKLVEQNVKVNKTLQEAKKSAKAFAVNSLKGAESIRKNREDFRSLNPAIKASAEAAKLATSVTGKLLGTVGDAINTFSIFGGPITKVVGMLGGTALSALGGFMESNAKRIATLGQAFSKFALEEMQTVVDAYRSIGSVGGITSKGMSGVYDDAIRAGMSVKEYSQLIVKEGENLAGFAGSVTAGAKSLGAVSQANEGYKKEYLALGYTYSEQQEATAEYLKRNRVISGKTTDDTQELAEGSRQYMDMLDEIARLTGKTRSQASKDLEMQESNLRFQAAMRAATERTGNQEIANNMRKMSEGISAFGSEGMAQGWMDITSGLGTKASRDFNLATNGEGQKIAEMVKRGEIDYKQGLELVQAAAERRWNAIGGDEYVRKVAKTGSAMDDSLAPLSRLVHGQKLTAENLEKLTKEQKAAKEAKDKETKNIISAQEALRQMGIDMDKMVKDKVFPMATTAVSNMTGLFVKFVNTAADTLGLQKVEVPTTGTLPEGGAGGEAVKPGEGKPNLTAVTTPGGKTAQVNADAAPAFQKLVNWLEKDAGYKIKSIGGYADRDVRGKPGVKSVHAIGGAIDINPEENPLGKDLVTDLPPNTEAAAKALGLGWGGAWKHGRKDAMHFSAATREGGSILQFATGGIASGPKSGYAAMLHGNEAVVPLPNGTDIPVESTGMSESTQQQIKTIRRQNQIINELIAAARSNNEANRRIVSLKAS